MSNIKNILADVSFDNETQQVTGARAFMAIWLLNQNGTKEDGNDLIDEVAGNWENQFIADIILNPIPGLPRGLRMDALAERR